MKTTVLLAGFVATMICATVYAADLATAETATKGKPFVNSLGMKFVPVDIGGGPTKGKRVLFSIWDTRVQDYAAYAAGKGVDDGWSKQSYGDVPIGRELDHPVVSVSWKDARAFCLWLTNKETAEGKLPKGLEYRLPMDEEWSWAVGLPAEVGDSPAEKAGNKTSESKGKESLYNSVDFPWGKDYPPKGKVGNYADEAYHGKFPFKEDAKEEWAKHRWIQGYTDGYPTTSPVGSFPANAHGLYDMGGNVWQWCEDFFRGHASFTKDLDFPVLRGASWNTSDRALLLSSSRLPFLPGLGASNFGFRCVLAPAR